MFELPLAYKTYKNTLVRARCRLPAAGCQTSESYYYGMMQTSNLLQQLSLELFSSVASSLLVARRENPRQKISQKIQKRNNDIRQFRK